MEKIVSIYVMFIVLIRYVIELMVVVCMIVKEVSNVIWVYFCEFDVFF